MKHGISLKVLPLEELQRDIRRISINSDSDIVQTSIDSDKAPVIIDARPKDEFAAGHIPGAISMCWEDWCDPAPRDAPPVLCQCGYWGALADPIESDAAARLTSLELANDSRIVVYANGVESKGRDGRIAWMLLYFGATNVALLDAGFDAWVLGGGAIETDGAIANQQLQLHRRQDECGIATGTVSQNAGPECGVDECFTSLESGVIGHSATADIPPKCSRSFVLNLQHQRRALFGDVLKRFEAADSPFLIDTRSLKEFEGWIYDYQPRLGRIPGAVSLPFSQMFNSSGRYISDREYSDLFCGTEIDQPVIAYCEVGVRAATVALLHEIFTGEVIPVYDGSFMEWSLRAENQVVCGTGEVR